MLFSLLNSLPRIVVSYFVLTILYAFVFFLLAKFGPLRFAVAKHRTRLLTTALTVYIGHLLYILWTILLIAHTDFVALITADMFPTSIVIFLFIMVTCATSLLLTYRLISTSYPWNV